MVSLKNMSLYVHAGHNMYMKVYRCAHMSDPCVNLIYAK